jgi:hypothetical protein
MFSRGSFKPQTQPLFHSPLASPKSNTHTQLEDHTSPFEEGEDEYDFNIQDPRFIPSSRSRSGSEIYSDHLRNRVEGEDKGKEKGDIEGTEYIQEESRVEPRTLSERLKARDREGGEVSLPYLSSLYALFISLSPLLIPSYQHSKA